MYILISVERLFVSMFVKVVWKKRKMNLTLNDSFIYGQGIKLLALTLTTASMWCFGSLVAASFNREPF